MTECGDNVATPYDVCHPENPQWCAIIIDNEFPEVPENNETGDENVDIVVSKDGTSFIVENLTFNSTPSYNNSTPMKYAYFDNDFNLTIPFTELGGQKYGFTLQYFQNPDDPFGHYWKLDLNSITGVE